MASSPSIDEDDHGNHALSSSLLHADHNLQSPSCSTARVPPSAAWNHTPGSNMSASLHHATTTPGLHTNSPLDLMSAAEDDRVALLRMPSPSSSSSPNSNNGGGLMNVDAYGYSSEEKKDGGSSNSSTDMMMNIMAHNNSIKNGNLHTNQGINGLLSNNGLMKKSPSGAAVFTHLTQSLPSTSLLMKRLGHILAISSTAIFLLLVFPLLVNSAIKDARQGKTDFAAFYSAAGFVVITLVLSMREILSHLYNWYAPDVQKFVVRILFMVPLYSVQSWLSLRFHGPARVYIDTVRDLYEAYVIQSFVYYLIELLGGEDRMADLLSQKESHYGHHGSFMSVFIGGSWTMGKDFLLKIKHGVLQYVVVKTILTLLTTFVFLPSGNYGEGSFSWSSAYVYITTILNVSVMYALYCLVKLFHAVKSDLRSPINWHPVGKFLCVKGVVFFTWWQGVIIYFLRSHGMINDVGSWTGDEVANGIIDYLVCVEMVFFAIAHMFTFTYKEYLPEGMEAKKKSGIVGWMFEGIDKRRRNGHHSSSGNLNGSNGQVPPALQSALLEDEEVTPCIDEDGNIAESSYRPPATSGSGFSKLEDPLSLREALWSSTVPRETLDDIKRLGVVSGRQSGFGLGSGRGSGIGLATMNNALAESI